MTRLTPLALLLLAGCAYPNQFRNVDADAPHAVLVGDGVTVMHINRQPTSFWRVRETFRIPPGRTTLRAVAGHWDIHSYTGLVFTAEVGQRYSLRRDRTAGSDRVVVRDRDEHIVSHAEAERRETQ